MAILIQRETVDSRTEKPQEALSRGRSGESVRLRGVVVRCEERAVVDAFTEFCGRVVRVVGFDEVFLAEAGETVECLLVGDAGLVFEVGSGGVVEDGDGAEERVLDGSGLDGRTDVCEE